VHQPTEAAEENARAPEDAETLLARGRAGALHLGDQWDEMLLDDAAIVGLEENRGFWLVDKVALYFRPGREASVLVGR